MSFKFPRIQRTVVIFAIATSPSQLAFANESVCNSPAEISPPATLDTDEIANEWIAKMDHYTFDIEQFLVCVADHIETNQGQLTDSEVTDLRRSQERAIGQARRTADAWNRAFAKYQQDRAD